MSEFTQLLADVRAGRVNNPICTRKNGRCRARLTCTTDGIGRVLWTCERCARNDRGVCRDCPRPLSDRRAMRCDVCRAARKRKQGNAAALRHYYRNREKKLAQQREYRSRPEVRAHHREYFREWNAKIPREVRNAAQRVYQREYAARKKA